MFYLSKFTNRVQIASGGFHRPSVGEWFMVTKRQRRSGADRKARDSVGKKSYYSFIRKTAPYNSKKTG